MSDLVSRLRSCARVRVAGYTSDFDTFAEAADRIEHLEAALRESRETHSYYLRELGSDYIRNTILKIDEALGQVDGGVS